MPHSHPVFRVLTTLELIDRLAKLGHDYSPGTLDTYRSMPTAKIPAPFKRACSVAMKRPIEELFEPEATP